MEKLKAESQKPKDQMRLREFVRRQLGMHVCKREMAFALFGKNGRGRHIGEGQFLHAVRRVQALYGGKKRPLELWRILVNGLQGPDPWLLRPTAAEERWKEERLRNPHRRIRYEANAQEAFDREKKRQLRAMKLRI